RDLLDALGPETAHRLRSIPIGYLGSGTDTVAVAMVDPTDRRAIETLGMRLGATVTPYVVPELRALYYLEKHFGTPRRARFIRTAQPDAQPETGTERRRTQPAGGITLPPKLTLEPRRRRVSQAPSPQDVRIAISYGSACERID